MPIDASEAEVRRSGMEMHDPVARHTVRYGRVVIDFVRSPFRRKGEESVTQTPAAQPILAEHREKLHRQDSDHAG